MISNASAVRAFARPGDDQQPQRISGQALGGGGSYHGVNHVRVILLTEPPVKKFVHVG
jgi:hypothetical protein